MADLYHLEHKGFSNKVDSNTKSPDFSIIMKSVRALIALMCLSGGCASVLPSNPIAYPRKSEQNVSNPPKTVNKSAIKPTIKIPQNQTKPQNKDKADKPTPHNYDDPEDLKDVPCIQLKPSRPRACEIAALINKFISNV